MRIKHRVYETQAACLKHVEKLKRLGYWPGVVPMRDSDGIIIGWTTTIA